MTSYRQNGWVNGNNLRQVDRVCDLDNVSDMNRRGKLIFEGNDWCGSKYYLKILFDLMYKFDI